MPSRRHRKLRLGVLYPAFPGAPVSWAQAEDDYERMAELVRAPTTVRVVHTPWTDDVDRGVDDAGWVETLKELGSDARLLTGAGELRSFRPDIVTWACTSGSFLWGHVGAERQAGVLSDALGVPASSTSLAFLPALAALEVSRVAIASIYHPSVSDAFEAFLRAAEVETVGLTQLDHSGLQDFVTWGKARLLAIVDRADVPTAEAVVIPETGLHTVPWLDALERHAGKPVLTANQVTIWHALRLAGRYEPQDGLGALFQSS